MEVALVLLGDVRWRGEPVPGDRPRALLAALAASAGRPVRDERLVELVWGEGPPADAAKGLQVLVSRTRAVCGSDAIVRAGGGYRLGVGPAEVDGTRLAALVRDAAGALDRDAAASAALAREALALAGEPVQVTDDDSGPLSDVRRTAVVDVAAARVLLARAAGRTGAHAEALGTLEAASGARPDDEALLADLLRSEAAVRGPGAALARYERYRRGLRSRLGADPGEALQRVHRDLLALDRPVRRGVRHDPTDLLGRDADVTRLRALLAGSRVVSIVGAGGLGKTRLAHVLARDATQPVVHVVELAGVGAAEDVVGEVGSALGVRDSVSARRALTAAQRADVRGRIAQQLGQAPTLLVLDNCEHLVEAVADLVAFVVAATTDLRVLTTSRAPLTIAAERVHHLGELAVPDAVELFRRRAVAARPDARLDPATVRSVVARLDGVPLAIELAAAKVRAMAVEEIDRRLADRFALLRGGYRGAPDRHRTLLAVIDWSWRLLDAGERRALRWLAPFRDGCTLATAEAVLGDDALTAVGGLVDQSLLTVGESATGVRYRMLETVREFGRLRLAEAGEEAAARAARRRWATAYAGRYEPSLWGPGQIAAIDAVGAEEIDLTDELRTAITGHDRGTAVVLLAALGTLWELRGEHMRLVALMGPLAEAVDGWDPPPELADVTRAAMTVTLINALMRMDERAGPIRDLLRRLGSGPGTDPRLRAMVRVAQAFDAGDPDAPGDVAYRLERLAAEPDAGIAAAAELALSHVRESAGDLTGAVAASERALTLVPADDGPWRRAILHTQLAELTLQLGRYDLAVEHARTALPVMCRLGARDDEVELRALLVLCATAEGRLADAEAELARLDAVDDVEAIPSGVTVREIGRAELALAHGRYEAGLRAYRTSVARTRDRPSPGIAPTGVEPGALIAEATALSAHARFATDADVPHGRALYAACLERVRRLVGAGGADVDRPVTGLLLFALGAWGLRSDETPVETPVETSVALLVLADRFAYHRIAPSTAWAPVAARAEDRAPGRIAAFRARWADRPPPELLDEARSLVDRLTAGEGGAGRHGAPARAVPTADPS